MLWDRIEHLLLDVSHPAQYIGREINSIEKDINKVDVRFGFVFPDTYTIGMSNLGLQTMYNIINLIDYAYCERIFMPEADMINIMEENDIPAFSLETHSPISEFDILGFSLQYELQYTNVLKILKLGNIPLYSKDRSLDAPLIIAGGPCTFNPAPLEDFIDIFIIGDGEEIITEFIATINKLKGNFTDRQQYLNAISNEIPSVYIPQANNTNNKIKVNVADINKSPYPTSPVIPHLESVHNRINLEIMRGCPNNCLFCNARTIKFPVRTRDLQTLLKYAEETYKNTGFDEISVNSLSSGDYPDLEELIYRLNIRFASKNVGIAFPSLRAHNTMKKYPALINAVRKSGLTLAPEAGTDTLRQIIGKDVTDKNLIETASSAFKAGWQQIKLYFMIGLPGETTEDIEGIISLIYKMLSVGRNEIGNKAKLNVTISPFVPKPHTPFQWSSMNSREELIEKVIMIKNGFSRKVPVKIKYHAIESTIVESLLARGNKNTANVIKSAVDSGSMLDAWNEFFDFSLWENAGKSNGIDIQEQAKKSFNINDPLPWDNISPAVTKKYFLDKYLYSQKLSSERTTSNV